MKRKKPLYPHVGRIFHFYTCHTPSTRFRTSKEDIIVQVLNVNSQNFERPLGWTLRWRHSQSSVLNRLLGNIRWLDSAECLPVILEWRRSRVRCTSRLGHWRGQWTSCAATLDRFFLEMIVLVLQVLRYIIDLRKIEFLQSTRGVLVTIAMGWEWLNDACLNFPRN